MGVATCPLPWDAAHWHIATARVSGFDTALFGLPSDDVWPILFEHPAGGILVATTKLSRFRTARYAPADAWPSIWSMILRWGSSRRLDTDARVYANGPTGLRPGGRSSHERATDGHGARSRLVRKLRALHRPIGQGGVPRGIQLQGDVPGRAPGHQPPSPDRLPWRGEHDNGAGGTAPAGSPLAGSGREPQRRHLLHLTRGQGAAPPTSESLLRAHRKET